MSLINNMLKDLEKRNSQPREFTYIPIINKYPKNSVLQKHTKLFAFIFIIFIFSFYSYLFFSKNSQGKLKSFESTILTKNTLVPLNNAEQAWLNPASITGITIETKDNITEVTFELNHPALYRLDSSNINNQLSIIFDNATFQAQLPAIDSLNSAIEKINSQLINSDTKFSITLAAGSTIKYINLNRVNSRAELVLAIESPPVKYTEEQALSHNNIKKPLDTNLLLQRYQSALLSAENGEYQSALEHLESLVKIDPHFNDARASLVALLIDQGSVAKARNLVDEGLNSHPAFIPFIELKARLLSLEGKPKLALTVLQNASPRIDENPEYHALVAAMHEQNNNFMLAANIYRQLLALNPNNGNWWFGLGVSLDKIGKNKEAVDAYIHANSKGHLTADSLTYLQTRLQKLQEEIDAAK